MLPRQTWQITASTILISKGLLLRGESPLGEETSLECNFFPNYYHLSMHIHYINKWKCFWALWRTKIKSYLTRWQVIYTMVSWNCLAHFSHLFTRIGFVQTDSLGFSISCRRLSQIHYNVTQNCRCFFKSCLLFDTPRWELYKVCVCMCWIWVYQHFVS